MSNKKIKNINFFAEEITLKLICNDFNILNTFIKSNLFKIYIASQLQNKNLCLNFNIDLLFLDKKINVQIIDFKMKEDEKDKKEFCINSNTKINFDNQEIEIEKLSKEIENNLNINKDIEINDINELSEENKNFLKKILEEKYLNFNLDYNENKIYKPIIYEDIYNEIIKIINFKINNNEQNNEILKNKNLLNEYSYKGIIINGNEGIGKTHIINCILQNYIIKNNITYFYINIFKDFKDNENENIKYIKNIFLFSKLLNPSIIIIENLDIIFPENSNDENNNKENINLLLFEFIIQIKKLTNKTFLLITTKNKLNSNLTKLNLLDYQINLNLPTFIERKKLIENYLQDFNNNLSPEEIELLSEKTHGFVPGDIVKLFKESYIKSNINNILDKNNNILTYNIIIKQLNDIKPINLKDIIIDIPKVKWSEIGGNKDIIKKIRQNIEWPLKNPEIFKKLGIIPPNGTLLYGPPGCSKTMIAKALATESGLNFFAVKGPELFSKYVGDTEKAVRDIFKKAKISSPSIIFFDEIDSMASSRSNDNNGVEDKVLCQLLNEMDGIEGNGKVIIFGATNRPDILDKALIRPGRFDRLIYIPPPDLEGREEIFKINLSKMKINNDEIDYKQLSKLTENFSGADIAKVTREAGMIALSNDINCEYIDKKYIIESIKNTKPIISSEMIKYFEDFEKKSELF